MLLVSPVVHWLLTERSSRVVVCRIITGTVSPVRSKNFTSNSNSDPSESASRYNPAPPLRMVSGSSTRWGAASRTSVPSLVSSASGRPLMVMKPFSGPRATPAGCTLYMPACMNMGRVTSKREGLTTRASNS